jgi:adenylate cyclase
MSGDPEQEYFSDGIGETSPICRDRGHIVVARNCFTYKGRRSISVQVGRERMQSVLEGSIRRTGNRVRITATCRDHGTHLWGDRYDRDLTDILGCKTTSPRCEALSHA